MWKFSWRKRCRNLAKERAVSNIEFIYKFSKPWSSSWFYYLCWLYPFINIHWLIFTIASIIKLKPWMKADFNFSVTDQKSKDRREKKGKKHWIKRVNSFCFYFLLLNFDQFAYADYLELFKYNNSTNIWPSIRYWYFSFANKFCNHMRINTVNILLYSFAIGHLFSFLENQIQHSIFTYNVSMTKCASFISRYNEEIFQIYLYFTM